MGFWCPPPARPQPDGVFLLCKYAGRPPQNPRRHSHTKTPYTERAFFNACKSPPPIPNLPPQTGLFNSFSGWITLLFSSPASAHTLYPISNGASILDCRCAERLAGNCCTCSNAVLSQQLALTAIAPLCGEGLCIPMHMVTRATAWSRKGGIWALGYMGFVCRQCVGANDLR